MSQGMTLGQLLNSSKMIRSLHTEGRYGMDYVLANKTFGNVYYNDKVVYYNEQYNILELRMTMSTKTETGYNGLHAIRMAIYAPKGKIYDSIDDLRRAAVQKKVSDHLNDPNQIDAARSKSNNMMRHDIEGAQSGLKGREYTADASTRSLADIGPNTEEFVKSYGTQNNTDDTDAENYIMNNLRGVVLPCASASENFSQNYLPNGRVFHLEEPINLNSFVRVSCTCSSYHFDCAWYNNKAGAHLGPAPMSYNKRTARQTTVRNIDQNPGLCKHLTLFAMMLLDSGILSGMTSRELEEYNKTLMLRQEHLNIPKRFPENSTVLKRALNKTDRALNEWRKELSFVSNSPDPQKIYDDQKRRANYAAMQAGDTSIRSINQGTGKKAYNREVLYGETSQTYKDMMAAADAVRKQHQGRQRRNKHI